MRKAAAIVALVSGSVPCYPQDSNVTHGPCSPIISGNQNSIKCNFPKHTPKPSLSDIQDDVIEYNKFPGYVIDGVEYRNGHAEEGDKYVVDVAVNIETRFSCDEIGKGSWVPKEDRDAALILGLAGIKIAWMRGMKCKAGERFSLLYADEFQKTENGWSLIDQETIGAEQR